MFNRRLVSSNTLGALLFFGIATMATAVPAGPAAAQGIFDFFVSRPPPPSARAYADPYSSPYPPRYSSPYGSPRYSSPDGPRYGEPERRVQSGPAVSYCVRLCDGRFFPIQRSNANPAQVCSAFCPAAQTKIYSGGSIDHAVAQDGTRYAGLKTAFAYRKSVVEGCTCNGKDAYGLVTMHPSEDPTLRNGDIVATDKGFVAYTGNRSQNAQFTPIESVSGLASDVRRRLAGTKIVPRNASPVPPASATGPRKTASTTGQGPQRRTQLSR